MMQLGNSADLLVTGRYLYLQDHGKTVVHHGGVAFYQDSIIAVDPAAELAKNILMPMPLFWLKE